MITSIDPAAATGVGAQAPGVKRHETDKIAEAYQTKGVRDSVAFEEAGNAAKPAEKAGVGVPAPNAEPGPGKQKKNAPRDQAAINFQMTREEREVFLSAMSGREKVSDMSEDEQKLMERASERLEKIIEAADARDTASYERIDKAVKEWYLRLSNGKLPPADLLTLIRQSAAGELD